MSARWSLALAGVCALSCVATLVLLAAGLSPALAVATVAATFGAAAYAMEGP